MRADHTVPACGIIDKSEMNVHFHELGEIVICLLRFVIYLMYTGQ